MVPSGGGNWGRLCGPFKKDRTLLAVVSMWSINLYEVDAEARPDACDVLNPNEGCAPTKVARMSSILKLIALLGAPTRASKSYKSL